MEEALVVGIFDGGVTVQQMASGNVAQMRVEWLPWQNLMRQWDLMVFPQRAYKGFTFEPKLYANAEALEKARSQYVSTWVKTRANAMLNRLTRAQPKIRVATVGDADERERASQMQLASRGILNLLDQQVRDNHEGESWDRNYKAGIVFNGKVISRPILQETSPGSGEATVDELLLDPYTTYHDFNTWPKRYAYERWLTKGAIEGLCRLKGYPMPESVGHYSPTDMISTVDFWVEEPSSDRRRLRVYNCLLINHIVVTPEEEVDVSDKFKHVPILITCRRPGARDYRAARTAYEGGGMGQSPGSINTPGASSALTVMGILSIERHAEPFYAPAREALAQLELLRSLQMDSAALAALKPVVRELYPDAQQSELNANPTTPGSRVTVTANTQKWTPLDLTGDVSAVETVINDLKDDLEGIFSSKLVVPFTSSGDSDLKFKDEIDLAETVMVPEARIAAQHKTAVLNEIFHQLTESPGLSFQLRARSQTGAYAGQTLLVNYTGKDMPKQWQLEVEEPPMLPKDDFKQIQIYTQATTGEAPAYDPVKAREVYLDEEQAQDVDEKVWAYRARHSPERQDLDVLESMDEDVEEAQAKLHELLRSKDASSEEVDEQRLELKVMQQRYAEKERALLGGAPPEEESAPPRPDNSLQPPEAQGFNSPTYQQQAGVEFPQAMRPGVQPNPATGPVPRPNVRQRVNGKRPVPAARR